MTYKEALEILDTIPTIGDQVDALEMAIKALEEKDQGMDKLIETVNDLIPKVIALIFDKVDTCVERIMAETEEKNGGI